MVTNAELNKEVKILKQIVKLMLDDISKYSNVSMTDAKEYLKLL